MSPCPGCLASWDWSQLTWRNCSNSSSSLLLRPCYQGNQLHRHREIGAHITVIKVDGAAPRLVASGMPGAPPAPGVSRSMHPMRAPRSSSYKKCSSGSLWLHNRSRSSRVCRRLLSSSSRASRQWCLLPDQIPHRTPVDPQRPPTFKPEQHRFNDCQCPSTCSSFLLHYAGRGDNSLFTPLFLDSRKICTSQLSQVKASCYHVSHIDPD